MTVKQPTIVFVPGALHYPECFKPLIEHLQKHGYETKSVKLKSVITQDERRAESHHEDADTIRATVIPLIEQGKDVIVFCHSYGGIPTSEGLFGLGEKEGQAGGVVHIIYCCAFVLLEGQSLMTLMQQPEFKSDTPPSWYTLESDGLTLRLLKEHAMETLYADVEPVLAQKAVEDVGLHSFKTFLSAQTKCAYKEIPSTYILCEEDKAIPPVVQRYMVEQANIKDIVKLHMSHSPFLARPDEVFCIIDSVVKGKGAPRA